MEQAIHRQVARLYHRLDRVTTSRGSPSSPHANDPPSSLTHPSPKIVDATTIHDDDYYHRRRHLAHYCPASSTHKSTLSFLMSVFAGTRDLSGPRTGRDPDLEFDPRNRASQLPPLTDPLQPPEDEDTVYDSRGQRTRRRLGDDFAEDVAATTRRFRARVAAMGLEDELEASTAANQSRRSAADLLESAVTARKGAKTAIEEVESGFKRRSRLFDEMERADESKPAFTRWSRLINEDDELVPTSAAANRAMQTKARLHDLESEMEQLADRQAKRERRAAALRALVNESAAAADDVVQQSTISKKVSMRSVQGTERAEKHVNF